MNLLLDTHSFLWFILNDAKLSDPARHAIQDRANIVHISPASYWEIAIKVSLGRYRMNTDFEIFWNAGIDDNKFSILPITPLHAAALAVLPFHHRDPFDRMLVAQAIVEDATVVTADPALKAYSITCLW